MSPYNPLNPLGDIKIRIITNTDGVDRCPMICIDNDDISYTRLVGLYTAGDGVGMQSNPNIDETAALKMCERISAAVREYYINHLPVDQNIPAPPTFFDERDDSQIGD